MAFLALLSKLGSTPVLRPPRSLTTADVGRLGVVVEISTVGTRLLPPGPNKNASASTSHCATPGSGIRVVDKR